MFDSQGRLWLQSEALFVTVSRQHGMEGAQVWQNSCADQHLTYASGSGIHFHTETGTARY